MSTDAPRDRVVVTLPTGVSVHPAAGSLEVRGPLGHVRRTFPGDALEVAVDGGAVTLTLKIPWNRKRSQALLHTWEAHLKNLGAGVTVGFVARMKVVAAHFPMKVAVKDQTLVIENFLG